MLLVIFDEQDREWTGPPPGMKSVYHAKMDLAQLELTEAEIELHATTLVKDVVESYSICGLSRTKVLGRQLLDLLFMRKMPPSVHC